MKGGNIGCSPHRPLPPPFASKHLRRPLSARATPRTSRRCGIDRTNGPLQEDTKKHNLFVLYNRLIYLFIYFVYLYI